MSAKTLDETKVRSGFAVASVVVGILSIPIFPYGILGGIAIILGILALRKIKAAPESFSGKGIARAGIITGCIGLLFGIGGLALVEYQKGATLKVTNLDDAENLLFEQPDGESGFGNNENAALLARKMAAEIASFCENSISETPFGISIVGDKPRVLLP